MITVVLHLLALAVNQYVGIVQPWHCTQPITVRRAYVLIVLLWLAPAGVLHTYFAAVPGVAYRSAYCSQLRFFGVSRCAFAHSRTRKCVRLCTGSDTWWGRQ
jgi:melanocortin 2 receptor